MSKPLRELSFNELVKLGVEKELDAVVTGKKLGERVFALMELAVRWHNEQPNRGNVIQLQHSGQVR